MVRERPRVRIAVPGVSRRVRSGGRMSGQDVWRVLLCVFCVRFMMGWGIMYLDTPGIGIETGKGIGKEIIRTEIVPTAHSNTVIA